MRFLTTLAAVLVASFLMADVANARGGPRAGRGHRLPPEVKQKLLAEFDQNGDGKLDETGRQAARAAMKAKRKAMREKVLREFDADGDGTLNEEEKAAAKKAMRKRFASKFDANGDGELDEAEKAKAQRAWRRIQRVRAHRHRRGAGAGPRPQTTPSD